MLQDLSKAKIYKITNDYNDDIYVGSTCDLLTKRFSAHKRERNCAKRTNSKLYSLMREIGTERFCIYLIEEFPCDNKYELSQREGYWIREIGTLNQRIETRTSHEYRQDNKDTIQLKKKEYYAKHADLEKERKKQYYKENKEKFKEQAKANYYKKKEEEKDIKTI